MDYWNDFHEGVLKCLMLQILFLGLGNMDAIAN